MSELTEAIAAAHQVIQQLSALAGDATDGDARSLLSDLELLMARIEAETARLKLENIELHRHISSLEEVDAPKLRKVISPSFPPKPDVRETMKLVSQFYQLFSADRPYRKAG